MNLLKKKQIIAVLVLQDLYKTEDLKAMRLKQALLNYTNIAYIVTK